MSDAWAMNPGKAATAVGTATIEADDELFTITDHGLGVGDTVVVDTLTGGASGVLDEGQVYWVVDVSTNTFALSQHRNGAPVEFSSDGGADVYRFAPQFSAIELRRLDSGLLVNDSGDRFGAREGIHPASDPAISVSGTTWTVENVVGVVYPALTSTSGPYRFAHPTESGSLDPADGSNPRIDALDLQIQDNDEDASGQRRARVVYVAGTPASSPSAPAVTTNALRLGTILVPAGGSPSPSIDTLAQWTVASGGVLPVKDSTELPANPHAGMAVFVQERDATISGGEHFHNGSDWVPTGPGNVEVITSSDTYNPPDSLKAAMVECWGPGGGAGGADTTSAGETSVGSGGGGGGYSRRLILAKDLGSSVSVTIGTGGSGGGPGASAGSDGSGSTSFGAFLSASEGTGGDAVGSGTSGVKPNAGLPGSGSGGDLNVTGSAGGQGIRGEPATPFSQGHGGAAALGGGSARPSGVSAGGNGANGEAPGGGGSGAHNSAGAGTARSGGDGANGRCVVTEYY